MISDYKVIDTLNNDHKVFIVKNDKDNNVYVKKELSIFNEDIYRYLFDNPVKGIPRIREICPQNGYLVVFEGYISGNDLETLIDTGKEFSESEIIDISVQLCTILQNINSHGAMIVHRDIKPSNIILKEDGSVYLLDFNAAKYVDDTKYKDTTLIGTVGYAAPEQYGFGSSTTQTDIYAIGILIRSLLEPRLSSQLAPIIKKCTEIDPKNRYRSVNDLKAALLKKNVAQTDYLKMTPVGFRTKNKYKMIFASFVYLAIFFISFTLEVKDVTNVADVWLNRIFVFSVCMFHIALIFNYRNLQLEFGIKEEWPIWKKIISIVAVNLFLFVIELFSFAMVESILFNH